MANQTERREAVRDETALVAPITRARPTRPEPNFGVREPTLPALPRPWLVPTDPPPN